PTTMLRIPGDQDEPRFEGSYTVAPSQARRHGDAGPPGALDHRPTGHLPFAEPDLVAEVQLDPRSHVVVTEDRAEDGGEQLLDVREIDRVVDMPESLGITPADRDLPAHVRTLADVRGPASRRPSRAWITCDQLPGHFSRPSLAAPGGPTGAVLLT